MKDQDMQDGALSAVCLAKIRQQHRSEKRRLSAPAVMAKMTERMGLRRAEEAKKQATLLRDQDVSVYRVRVSSSLYCYDSGIPLKAVPGAAARVCASMSGLGRRLPSMAGNARSQCLSNNRSFSTGFARHAARAVLDSRYNASLSF